MYKLYYYPGNANLAAHICLRAIGVPFELVKVDVPSQAHKAPDYLRLNPTGRIPALTDGDRTVFESIACVSYLAARHPEARLAPPPDDPRFGTYLSWLSYLNNTVQPTVLLFFYAARSTETEAAAAEVIRCADRDLAAQWGLIEAAMGEGPYFLGKEPTALDYFLFMVARFSRRSTHKPSLLPKIGGLLRRLNEHPAVAAACAAEGLEQPYYDLPSG